MTKICPPEQQAQAQVPLQRQAYAQVAAKPQNQQPGRRPQNQPQQNNRANQPTKPPPPSWQQQNPTEMRTMDRPPRSNHKKTIPIDQGHHLYKWNMGFVAIAVRQVTAT